MTITEIETYDRHDPANPSNIEVARFVPECFVETLDDEAREWWTPIVLSWDDEYDWQEDLTN